MNFYLSHYKGHVLYRQRHTYTSVGTLNTLFIEYTYVHFNHLLPFILWYFTSHQTTAFSPLTIRKTLISFFLCNITIFRPSTLSQLLPHIKHLIKLFCLKQAAHSSLRFCSLPHFLFAALKKWANMILIIVQYKSNFKTEYICMYYIL